MELVLLYTDACPHVALARARLRAAMELTGCDGVLCDGLVSDAADADAIGFAGSPTILVDGRDPFVRGPAGLACRLYPGDDTLGATPSVEALVTALSHASSSRDALRRVD
jgi:hypothetical protein